MTKKERYEVIKFIEHGSRCRLTMDYVPGELLIDRLKEEPEIWRDTMFEWFHSLAIQLEQYHRSSKNQCYRYLNPYSVLVTEDQTLLLLDLEAESNEFVLKNLQKRSMRQHFLKPVQHVFEDTRLSRDLYGFGKTMQFILAQSDIEPSLTKGEENRLSKIIEKCLGENPKKQYESLKQIQKELPKAKRSRRFQVSAAKFIWILAAVLVILMIIVMTKVFTNQNTANTVPNESVETAAENPTKNPNPPQKTEDIIDKIAADTDQLNEYVLSNTVRNNREIIRIGTGLELEIVRCLASAYDREDQKEEAIAMYDRLCRLEVRQDLLETAYLRKITLETELGLYVQAVTTGTAAMETLRDSKNVAVRYLEAFAASDEYTAAELKAEYEKLIAAYPELESDEEFVNLHIKEKIEEKIGEEENPG